MKKSLFFLLVAIFSLAAPIAVWSNGDGAALYKKKMCGACHGAGKTGGDLAKSKLDKAAMIKFLKDPKAAKPKTAMPAFKGSDEELASLVDYLLGLRK